MDLKAIYDELELLPTGEHEYGLAKMNWRARAACAIAYCHEHGEGGLKQDFREAFKWYKISAGRGNRESHWKVACWYMEEKGVRKNYVCAGHARDCRVLPLDPLQGSEGYRQGALLAPQSSRTWLRRVPRKTAYDTQIRNERRPPRHRRSREMGSAIISLMIQCK